MKQMSIKAILLGCLTVFILDIIGSILLLVFFGGNKSPAALRALETEIVPLLFSLIVGTMTTIFGGYIAAMIAKSSLYLNSGIIGLIDLFAGLFIGSGLPLWFNITCFISVIPASLIGGYFANLRLKQIISNDKKA